MIMSKLFLVSVTKKLDHLTEYGLEQVYNVIDSRYRSGKPLIVTTNLTLE